MRLYKECVKKLLTIPFANYKIKITFIKSFYKSYLFIF